MKITTENKYENNPRKITDKEKALLKEHLEEFGDLSGVVYCINNKAYVGGNQRSTVFDGSTIEIAERFNKPTNNKTTAHGFIIYNGEKYTYREVSFTKKEFKKACVVANSDGGSFDWEILDQHWEAQDLADWGVKVDFEIEEETETESSEPKDLSDEMKETFEVIVECNNENELELTYNKLTKEGYTCRVLTL